MPFQILLASSPPAWIRQSEAVNSEWAGLANDSNRVYSALITCRRRRKGQRGPREEHRCVPPAAKPTSAAQLPTWTRHQLTDWRKRQLQHLKQSTWQPQVSASTSKYTLPLLITLTIRCPFLPINFSTLINHLSLLHFEEKTKQNSMLKLRRSKKTVLYDVTKSINVAHRSWPPMTSNQESACQTWQCTIQHRC